MPTLHIEGRSNYKGNQIPEVVEYTSASYSSKLVTRQLHVTYLTSSFTEHLCIFNLQLSQFKHPKRLQNFINMGVPYSKEINAALSQVQPLVAAGFVVLRTTKNISILLMILQILTVLLLCLILVAAFALILSVNPDLSAERKALVTPVMKWVAAWLMSKQE
jgi:hypothetical protein